MRPKTPDIQSTHAAYVANNYPSVDSKHPEHDSNNRKILIHVEAFNFSMTTIK